MCWRCEARGGDDVPQHNCRNSVVSMAVNFVAPAVVSTAAAGSRRAARELSAAEPVAVHRLDLETSGVLLLAKHKRAASDLRAQFENREVKKTYLALCAVVERSKSGPRRSPASGSKEKPPR